MNKEEIIRLRLFNQRLSAIRFAKPDDVVAHFGAMQAQDYSMALWAVGLRMANANRAIIENMIDSGEIIRTHILRPTWHLVHKNDIRWMMELSAPYVKKATQYIDKKEGFTNELFLEVWKIIEAQFNQKDNLTKEDIIYCLSEQHITVSNLLATQIIIRAELEMLLCNGEKKGTYSLFEKRIPPSSKISKSEAIVKLTQIYFQSRGPATVKDFAWWSGLSVSDAKMGIAELGIKLDSFEFDKLKFYFFEPKDRIVENPISTLLPCYDEYTVGYSEGRNVVIPTDLNYSETGNGIFKPIILSENEIVGTWKKIKKSPFVEVQTFSNNKGVSIRKINESIETFNIFNK